MEKTNVYQMVTDRIIEQLSKGIIPWQKPWSGGENCAINYVTRKPYSLLNQMLLGLDGEYLTFNQVKSLGGSIRKGAKSRIVVFYCNQTSLKQTVKLIDDNGDEHDEVRTVTTLLKFPILKHYRVFHINDCNGIETKYIQGNEHQHNPVEEAENIISNYLQREKSLKFNTAITDEAFFSPLTDTVSVPAMSQYEVVEEYYSTTFHELTHSTMIEKRCNRKNDILMAAFGSDDYSKEELVAEIGSAMLCNIAGLDNEKAFNNSVAYIKCWMDRIKSDNKLIIRAAAKAEQSTKYILNQ